MHFVILMHNDVDHMHNAVAENTEIIDYNNWTHLQYLETYCIKKQCHLKLISGWKLQKKFNYSSDYHSCATL